MSKENGTIKKTKIKKSMRDDGPPTFNFEDERAKACFGNQWVSKSLYNEANNLEEQNIFDLESFKPEQQLNQLAVEVKIRVKITQQEIFKIGGLLCKAKSICQEQSIGFKKWIEKTFDFSYETANNFKNVYKSCFGRISIAKKLSPSILYKLSAPNFPDQLREYLFDNANLEEMTNGRLEGLVKKYKEGGMEAIEDDIQELQYGMILGRQTAFTLDQFENALRTLDSLEQKMNTFGRDSCIFSLEGQVEHQVEEAKEINLTLYDALKEAIKILDRGKKDAFKIIGGYIEKVENKYMTPEWKKELQFDTEEYEEWEKNEEFEKEFQT